MNTILSKHEAGPFSLDKEFVAVADAETKKTKALFGNFRHDVNNLEEQEKFINTVASAILFSISGELLRNAIKGIQVNPLHYLYVIRSKASSYLIMDESLYKDLPRKKLALLEERIVQEVLSQSFKTDN